MARGGAGNSKQPDFSKQPDVPEKVFARVFGAGILGLGGVFRNNRGGGDVFRRHLQVNILGTSSHGSHRSRQGILAGSLSGGKNMLSMGTRNSEQGCLCLGRAMLS